MKPRFWMRLSISACSSPCGRYPKKRRPYACEQPRRLNFSSSVAANVFQIYSNSLIMAFPQSHCVSFVFFLLSAVPCPMASGQTQKRFASSPEMSPTWPQSRPRGFIRSFCRREVSKAYQRYAVLNWCWSRFSIASNQSYWCEVIVAYGKAITPLT